MMLCNREDGAHLDALAVWLGSMLAWDSSVTKDEYYAAIEEWFNIVYGGAGENMYEYMRMCEYAANHDRLLVRVPFIEHGKGGQ